MSMLEPSQAGSAQRIRTEFVKLLKQLSHSIIKPGSAFIGANTVKAIRNSEGNIIVFHIQSASSDEDCFIRLRMVIAYGAKGV
jgi:hypothetical protein